MKKIRANNPECAEKAPPGIGNAPGFTVVDKIAPQHGAVSGLAVSPDGTKLIATHHGNDSVSLLDTGGRAPARAVVNIDEPFAIAVSETPQARAYISTVSAAYDSILTFDVAANRVVASQPVAHSVTDVAVSSDGRHVYASQTAAHGVDVAILDTKTGEEDAIGISASGGTTAQCVRVSPDGRRLYVAVNEPFAARLVVIDAQHNRVLSSIEIGSPIRDVALSPDGATAYVGSCGPDFGVVLDVLDMRHTRIDTYKLGEIAGLLTQLVLSRDGERAYLVGDTGVTVLSTSTHDVISTIVVGASPSCVTESPDGSRLYVADYAGAITVLSTASSDALNPDEAPTAPHPRAFADQLALEPVLA
jgi:DNA-binding beta-propeller fold protein YncE